MGARRQLVTASDGAEGVQGALVTLCITAYNEVENVPQLADLLTKVNLAYPGLVVGSIVDNGSTDGTLQALRAAFPDGCGIRVQRIDPNRGYGGGLIAAIAVAPTPYVCTLPADGQYPAEAVITVVRAFLDTGGPSGHPRMVKGLRQVRDDEFLVRLFSRVYTASARLILRVRSHDVNGLPKCFLAARVIEWGDRMPLDFVLDAAILRSCAQAGDGLLEVPVPFGRRRHGVSSWAGRRFRVAAGAFVSLFGVRRRIR